MRQSGETALSASYRSRLPDPRDRNATGRTRLLDAAFCLLLEDGPRLLAEAVTATRLTARSHQSRQAFYDNFDGTDRECFLVEALARATGIGGAHDATKVDGVSQVLEGVATHITSDGIAPRDMVRVLAAENFNLFVEDPTFVAQLLLAALAPSSERAASTLAFGYRSWTADYEEAYRALLRHWGRAVRTPFTVERLAVILTGLAEGMAMRAIVDPDVDASLFADAVEVIANYVLVPAGDFDEIRTHTAVGVPERLQDLPSSATRSQIVDAAIRVFGQAASRTPTISDLATAAGVSEQTIRNHFGGLAGAVIAAWSEWIPEFSEAIERDRARLPELTAVEVIRRHLHRVAVKAFENPELAGALVRVMQTSVEHAPQFPIDPRDQVPFPIILRELLLDAHRRGEILLTPTGRRKDGIEDRATLLARTLTNTLFVMIVTNPNPSDRSPDRHAHWCVDYLWSLVRGLRHDHL